MSRSKSIKELKKEFTRNNIFLDEILDEVYQYLLQKKENEEC